MTKRFVFLLALVLVLMASTLTAFAGNETPLQGTVTEEKAPPAITSPGGIEYYATRNEALFFDPENTSDSDLLVKMYAARDIREPNPLRYVLTGSVIRADGETVTSVEDNVIVLLYIKRDGEYVPLKTIDAKIHNDTNMVETPLLVYCKVLLDNLGNDKVNEVRLIAFRRADADRLVLGKTLQISDMRIVARTTITDRFRIGMDFVQNSLNPLTR
jgi:hypothetical protein